MSDTIYHLSDKALETLKACAHQTDKIGIVIGEDGTFKGIVIQYYKIIGYSEKQKALINQIDVIQIK